MQGNRHQGGNAQHGQAAQDGNPIVVSFYNEFPQDGASPFESYVTYDGRVTFPKPPVSGNGTFKNWIDYATGNTVTNRSVFREDADVYAYYEPKQNRAAAGAPMPRATGSCPGLVGGTAANLQGMISNIASGDEIVGSLLATAFDAAVSPAIDPKILSRLTKAMGQLEASSSDAFCCTLDALLWCGEDSVNPCCQNISDPTQLEDLAKILLAIDGVESILGTIVADTNGKIDSTEITGATTPEDIKDALCTISREVSAMSTILDGAGSIEGGAQKKLCCLFNALCQCRLDIDTALTTLSAPALSDLLETIVASIVASEASSNVTLNDVGLALDELRAQIASTVATDADLSDFITSVTPLIEDLASIKTASAKKLCCSLRMLCNDCLTASCGADTANICGEFCK